MDRGLSSLGQRACTAALVTAALSIFSAGLGWCSRTLLLTPEGRGTAEPRFRALVRHVGERHPGTDCGRGSSKFFLAGGGCFAEHAGRRPVRYRGQTVA